MRPLPTAVLLLAIAAVFWPALGGEYLYDDTLLIAKNAAVAQFDLRALLTAPLFGNDVPYWRPLTSLTFAIGHHLGGATGIHAIALLLHAANTLLVFALARRWLVAPTAGSGAAFGAALLFALHPVQAEAVAWCAAINDPLWVFWALLAVRAALRWRDGDTTKVPWAVATTCLLALLSKENALAALPIVWLVLRCEAPRPDWRRLLLTLGAALLAWLLLRMSVFGDWRAGLLGGRPGPDLPPSQVFVPFDLLAQHLRLLLVPTGLTPFHDTAGFPFGRALVSLVACVLPAALLFANLRRAPVWVRVGATLLVLPLLPTLLRWRALGSHPIGERYLYLCVFGAALLLAGATTRLGRRPQLALLLTLGAACGWITSAQLGVWQGQAQLVAHALQLAPHDAKVHVMAGALALRAAQTGDAAALATAQQHYATAERIAATHDLSANRTLGEARLGLAWCQAIAQAGHGRAAGAMLVEAFQRAVDTDRENAAAWIGLGVAHGMHENPAAAEQALRKGLELDPGNSEGWCNLGFLQLRTGRRDDARASLQRALQCDPGNARAAQLLAQAR
ncbi:MAG: tetratricopeptide repeat protein [Planctomycetes bacterium]|nr:tetratricopeptide repeat protein [Planctomycetota bacterium]